MRPNSGKLTAKDKLSMATLGVKESSSKALAWRTETWCQGVCSWVRLLKKSKPDSYSERVT